MRHEEQIARELKPKYVSLIKGIESDREVDPNECTIPFVPYVGSSYCQAKHKILIVGKATYGWGKGDSGQGSGTLGAVLGKNDLYEYIAKLPKKFIEEEIIPFYGGEKGHYHSQFWNRIYRLTGNLLLDCPVSEYKRERQVSEKCFRSIAWSNVFKVGATKAERGNPNPKLISFQKAHNTLEAEINILQPNIVIFSTGPTYDRYLKDLLPNSTLRDADPDDLGVKEVEGLESLAFRTCHFQYYSNQKFKQVVGYIRSRMNP